MTFLINGIDTETTGVDQPKGDRIIEVAILTFDFATRKMVDRYVQRIDPERPIAAAAQAVHGISYSDLVGQPKWEDVAPEVGRRLDAAPLAIAHNMDFDGPFIAGEMVRVGLPPPNPVAFCTMRNGRWATFDGKSPKLQELAFSLGVNYDPKLAHAAEYDVAIMMACFFRAYDRGFFKLPESLLAKAA
jgi:DNA polymerase-3 subunit epsilon